MLLELAARAAAAVGVAEEILRFETAEALTDASLVLSDEQAFAKGRTFQVVRMVKSMLEMTSPMFISSQGLAMIHDLLVRIRDELNNYTADKVPSRFENMARQTDAIITGLPAFAPQQLSSAETTTALSSLAEASNKTIKQLQEQRDGLSTKIAELQSLVDGQAARIRELADAVELQRKEAIGVVAEVRTSYNELVPVLRSEFKEQADNAVNEARNSRVDLEARARDALQSLGKSEADAKRIVQVVGNIGVTGNYQNIALTETRAANRWRWATILFFGLGVVIAVGSFLVHLFGWTDSSESLGEFAVRFVTAITISLPAIYTARESARHRTNADKARQTEIELASLGPFIEFLPEDKKIAIREKLIALYFGREIGAHTSDHPIDPKNIGEVLEQVLKIVKEVKA